MKMTMTFIALIGIFFISGCSEPQKPVVQKPAEQKPVEQKKEPRDIMKFEERPNPDPSKHKGNY